jgi:hypothetical protein
MSIPTKYIEFCKQVAMLARHHEIDSVSLRVYPRLSDVEWRNPVEMQWELGRHGESSKVFHVSSKVEVHEFFTNDDQENLLKNIQGLECSIKSTKDDTCQ